MHRSYFSSNPKRLSAGEGKLACTCVGGRVGTRETAWVKSGPMPPLKSPIDLNRMPLRVVYTSKA